MALLVNDTFDSVIYQEGVTTQNTKNQQQALLQLGSTLLALEDVLAKTKGAAEGSDGSEDTEGTGATSNASVSSSASESDFGSAMTQMMEALALLQVAIAKYGNDKTTMDTTISQAQVKLAQANLTNVQNELEKISKDEQSQKTSSFWTKFAAVFVAIASIFTLNPAVIALAFVGMLMTVTPLMQEMTTGLSDLLQDCGMSKDTANLVAGIVITVAVIAATAVLAPEDTPELATEEVVDTTEDAVQEGMQEFEVEASQESSTGSNILSKLKSVFNAINPGAKVSMSLATGSTAFMSTGVPGALADCIADWTHASPEQKQKLEEYFSIIATVLTFALAILGGSWAGASASEQEMTGGLGKLMQSLQEAGLTSKLAVAGQVIEGVGNAGTATGETVTGAYLILQGQAQENLGEAFALQTILKAVMNLNSSETKDDQKNFAQVEGMLTQDNQDVAKLMQGMQGLADDLTTYAPR